MVATLRVTLHEPPALVPTTERAGLVALHRRNYRASNGADEVVWVRASDIQTIAFRYGSDEAGHLVIGSALGMTGGREVLVSEPPDAVTFALERMEPTGVARFCHEPAPWHGNMDDPRHWECTYRADRRGRHSFEEGQS